MKRFSYANTYSAYLSAVLFTLCCTAVLYPRDRSACKPLGCLLVNEGELCPTFPADCKELKACLNPLLVKQIEEVAAGCQEQETCDQRITLSSPTTITEPGRYCLLTDLNIAEGSAITVAAGVSRVVIDLNNHTISGTSDIEEGALVDVLGDSTDVAVINGTVRPLGSNTVGVRVQNTSQVTLRGLSLVGNNDISGEQRGLSLLRATDVKIENCSLTQIGFVPLELNGCSVGKVTCCQLFANDAVTPILGVTGCNNILLEQVRCDGNNSDRSDTNATACFSVENSSNITILQCTANNNLNLIGRGFFFGNNSSDCLCKQCEAKENQRGGGTPQLQGFRVQSSSRIIFDECIASNNSTSGNCQPFILFPGSECCILNCLASQNSAGLSGLGFNLITSSANNYVFNNKAIGNSSAGFRSAGGSGNVFLGNYAEANSPNYENVAPVVEFEIGTGVFNPSTLLTRWHNISAVP